jgi:drug/metabolite transporter (DMT)-like permease
MASRTRSSSRPSLGVLLGLVGVIALPAAIAYSRYSSTFSLVDAAWLIPVAFLGGIAALLLIRGTRGHVRFGGERPTSARLGRLLGVLGICLATSATIAIAFYEVLLHLEG